MKTHSEHPQRYSERQFLTVVALAIFVSVVVIFLAGMGLGYSLSKRSIEYHIPEKSVIQYQNQTYYYDNGSISNHPTESLN